MKKILIIFFVLLSVQMNVLANYNDVYIADIQYDWIRKTDVEKEAIISEVRDIIFEDKTNISILENLKSEYREILKDKNQREHYLAASAGRKECGEYNISAFYFGKQKHIYMYALQKKSDISKTYYYDALGKLRYIDLIYGEYPDYPYYAIQYNINGKPVSAIYYVSKDNQYLFDPDSTFKGVWYKHNLYDKHSDIILKRTTY